MSKEEKEKEIQERLKPAKVKKRKSAKEQKKLLVCKFEKEFDQAYTGSLLPEEVVVEFSTGQIVKSREEGGQTFEKRASFKHVIDFNKLLLDWKGNEIKERTFKLLDDSFLGKRPELGQDKKTESKKIEPKKKKKVVEEFDHEDLGFASE